MGQKSREASRAYKEVRRAGGSVDEAKAASEAKKAEWNDHYTGRKPFVYNGPRETKEDSSGWDFDSELNGEGTDWHTSEDL